MRLAIVAALCVAGPLFAQVPDGAGANGMGLGATRRGLEARAEQLEQTGRADAKLEATAIRQRLAQGDFKVGDRVVMVVEGEKELSDTFTVGLGQALSLPTIGDVSLSGVLRSELQTYLTRRLGESLRDPVVRARAYIRLSIEGAVTRPGYYGVPADGLLSDALMAAGGPMAEADMRKLRIERDGRPIWHGQALQQAIAQGRTIDDAGLIAGDRYIVPHRGRTSAGDVLRFGAFLLTIPVTVYTLTKIIH